MCYRKYVAKLDWICSDNHAGPQVQTLYGIFSKKSLNKACTVAGSFLLAHPDELPRQQTKKQGLNKLIN